MTKEELKQWVDTCLRFWPQYVKGTEDLSKRIFARAKSMQHLDQRTAELMEQIGQATVNLAQAHIVLLDHFKRRGE